jgi:hypothetical protein
MADFELEVFLRTHNTSNVHSESDAARYCGVSKTELMIKCVTSLMASMNACQRKLRLTILDDHSTNEWLDALTGRLMPSLRHPARLIHLEKSGHNASALAQFELMSRCPGLVYGIEDDYLHEKNAIEELLDTHENFSRRVANTGRQVALYPFDMPDNYELPWNGPCTIIHGPRRHWRTNLWSTFSMLIPGPKIAQHWKWFHLLATEYRTPWGEANNIHEGTTIANMFKTDVHLFTPIPSLALHMQFASQRDPYIDWKQWWDAVPGQLAASP